MAEGGLQRINFVENVQNISIVYKFVILRFMTTVIGHKSHEIEILVNTVYMYSSYGLLVLEFRPLKWGGCVITDAWNGESQV